MRMLPAKPPFPFQLALVVFGLMELALLVRSSQAAQPTTDPAEVQALYAIFDRWGLDRPGGGGDPCPDVDVVAKLNSSIMFESYDQAILCNCSYAQSTTCHVIGLKLQRKDVLGRIPEELANLTYLQNLYLDRNYLTGPLPPFIGNLSAMRRLSLSGNALSGTVPRELGNLNELILLGLGTNNFSGPLPPELGSSSSLQHLYVDSNGFSGKLPSTFAQLSNMTTFWAFDNNLSGKIPHFMGSWTKLTTL
ncbi:hypothetical protein Taro_015655 [Colocasia esculenta]|uniref:Uncharacterized protein n=1 Tax=Colocasia esculenta TaxID=4460 RepID=A0A843UHZ1_COLES|nr:hypothetical protein [Colocasia esculenta]